MRPCPLPTSKTAIRVALCVLNEELIEAIGAGASKLKADPITTKPHALIKVHATECCGSPLDVILTAVAFTNSQVIAKAMK